MRPEAEALTQRPQRRFGIGGKRGEEWPLGQRSDLQASCRQAATHPLALGVTVTGFLAPHEGDVMLPASQGMLVAW